MKVLKSEDSDYARAVAWWVSEHELCLKRQSNSAA